MAFSTVTVEAQIDPSALRRATSATVLIRVSRVYGGAQFHSTGSGVLISADGHVLTNWHVVAEQINALIYGARREVSTHVQGIDVVIGSGELEERTLPARIVARDRKRDLAILQVRFKPKSHLGAAEVYPLKVAQKVWVIGFPFGDLLSESDAGLEEPRNPELTVSSGIITSLRHDKDGHLRAIQTDAAVNPGNSGGPMLDAAGHLIGIINARIQGGEGIGFGIPINVLHSFLSKEAFGVKFRPTVVYDPPDAIVVTVTPILAHLDDARGTVRLDGNDIQPVEAPLKRQGVAWTATLGPPKKIAGKPLPRWYVAEIQFNDGNGRPIATRRFRLESLSLNQQPRLESSRDPARMMEDRNLFGNSISISDYTKGDGETAKKNRSLSDVAGHIKLKRSPNGSVVIDD